jgi:predicted phosphodiesterase
MTIALFSDVHANLPAFEAMLLDIDSRKVDAVYCLGDLVGYNVWPNEVIAEIRKRDIATLAGNHDVKVKNLASTLENTLEPGKNHAYHLITASGREYLNMLPAHIQLEFQLNNDHLNLLLVAAKAVEASPLPDQFADMLRNAY